jgi:Phage integrase, N-terminal SAM-like domain
MHQEVTRTDMAYAEKRGKGPRPWRVKYRIPGGEASQSGFETKQAALAWGRDQEAKVRSGTWTDPGAGDTTVSEWIDRWKAMHDVGPSTTANREYRIRRFIRPYWGKRTLNSLTGEEIAIWERKLPATEGVSRSTAKDARSLLHTILGDAASSRPPLIPFNPAVRPRNRGRRTGRGLDRNPQRAWATPLEVLLVAERAALLAGRGDEFTMMLTIGYTGMRWGETIGLEHDYLLPSLINVEWQLREVSGRFHRLPPKDDSYRSTNVEPLTPVDLPPFLTGLLAAQADKHARQRCTCAAEHDGSGRYVFLGPDGGHHRNSNYARRILRPACDGRHPPANGSPSRLVIADATAWPGTPAAAWPPAVPGKPFDPPSGRGTQRLISTQDTGRCPSCGHAVRLRLDGRTVAHKNQPGHCPGSGEQPADDTPLACWLPVKDGLTPHGLRHGHKTWMVEDGIPEILAEQRLGHQVPGMRGLYAHASQQMREKLTAALQARWDESLRQRAAIDPHSPVPLLDNLLAPFRAAPHLDTALSVRQ